MYQIDDPVDIQGAQHGTVANKGNEAMAFLQVWLASSTLGTCQARSALTGLARQFIIDYYSILPQSIVFMHGQRWRPLPLQPRGCGPLWAALRRSRCPGMHGTSGIMCPSCSACAGAR